MSAAAGLRLPIAGLPLVVRIDRRARGLRLAVSPAARHVRLTVPPRTGARTAQAFLDSQADWLAETARRLVPPAVPFAPGIELPLGDGRLWLLPGTGRVAQQAGDRLLVPGGEALFAGRVRRWLKAEAQRRLEADTRALAAQAGLRLAGVRVGDPKSRWGSCAADGRIAYSWRLILAPRFVQQALVAHEVAHLAHAHHGPAFWRLAEALLGESHAPARAWLKANGPRLMAYGAG
ncbi:MAG: M48 family metallopeptidase [Sphingomonadaceae bacterium]